MKRWPCITTSTQFAATYFPCVASLALWAFSTNIIRIFLHHLPFSYATKGARFVHFWRRRNAAVYFVYDTQNIVLFRDKHFLSWQCPGETRWFPTRIPCCFSLEIRSSWFNAVSLNSRTESQQNTSMSLQLRRTGFFFLFSCHKDDASEFLCFERSGDADLWSFFSMSSLRQIGQANWCASNIVATLWLDQIRWLHALVRTIICQGSAAQESIWLGHTFGASIAVFPIYL